MYFILPWSILVIFVKLFQAFSGAVMQIYSKNILLKRFQGIRQRMRWKFQFIVQQQFMQQISNYWNVDAIVTKRDLTFAFFNQFRALIIHSSIIICICSIVLYFGLRVQQYRTLLLNIVWDSKYLANVAAHLNLNVIVRRQFIIIYGLIITVNCRYCICI